MATNQNEEFAQHFYTWWRTTLKIFLKIFCPNTCNETAIKANFHFPIISLWKLSCHSNQSTFCNGKKKQQQFVEAHAMNISAKLQLYPPYSFWGVNFYILFSEFFTFWLPWQLIKLRGLDTKYMFGGSPLNKYFWKTLVKYLQWGCNKCQFSLFSLKVNGNFKLP